ncbi:uncharacterized protein LOC110810735 [Carica papaya]|uniref:uncharacterized protein LOC110810735 n=1 Tax=Carica papaya TaxID=3649 RepID=UPI000B8CE96B|nr:uncharacterized protein LOC110810735 [Carica papaya]
MPVPDPRTGQAFVWLISCFLFISIIFGGGCLISYMFLPRPPLWLPYIGVFLVCLPWLFWVLTFVYRILSRTFGFRMILGCGGGGGSNRDIGGGGGGGSMSNMTSTDHILTSGMATAATSDHEPDHEDNSSAMTPRRVQFGEAVVVGEQSGGDGSFDGKINRKKSNSSSSSSNSSVTSHESEVPLTISMVA